MKPKILLGAIMVTLGASAANAGVPDERGYLACEDRIQSELRDDGVVLNRKYYFNRGDGSRTYYINGSVWNDDGKRAAGRAACVTTANGREVVELRMEFGTYELGQTGIVAR